MRTFNGPRDYVFGVATSKDGARVAAGGADSVLFVWNGQNGQVIRKIPPPISTNLSQTPPPNTESLSRERVSEDESSAARPTQRTDA